jgi:hypothetical protein
MTFTEAGISAFSVTKGRYHIDHKNRSYNISPDKLRSEAISNLATCTKIQVWVLSICPNAENRAP